MLAEVILSSFTPLARWLFMAGSDAGPSSNGRHRVMLVDVHYLAYGLLWLAAVRKDHREAKMSAPTHITQHPVK
jgi:hypothetical protein